VGELGILLVSIVSCHAYPEPQGLLINLESFRSRRLELVAERPRGPGSRHVVRVLGHAQDQVHVLLPRAD
jgi:hypothetical protein